MKQNDYYNKRANIILKKINDETERSVERERNLMKFCELNGVELILRGYNLGFFSYSRCKIFNECEFPHIIQKNGLRTYLFLAKYNTFDKLEKYIHKAIINGTKKTIQKLEIQNEFNKRIQ